MLTTKATVRFAVITPALVHMLGTLERLSRELFGLPASMRRSREVTCSIGSV
jgi:hypothetical protein